MRWFSGIFYGSLFFILWACPAHSAIANTISAEQESTQKTISANQSMITRFESERRQWLQSPSAEAQSRLGKLESKIALLQSQNKILQKKLLVPTTATLPANASPMGVTKSFEYLRGEDWLRMRLADKQRFVYIGIGGLERQGVFVTRSPADYMEALDRIIGAEQELKKEYLDNLFVFCVYDTEPQTRETIRILREQSADGQAL